MNRDKTGTRAVKSSQSGVAWGFTLVELLVVIGMVGLLGSVLVASVGETREQNAINEKTASLNEIGIALERYRADKGEYPDSLYESDFANDPLYMRDVPTDPTADDERFAYARPDDRSGYCLAGGIPKRLDDSDGIDCTAPVDGLTPGGSSGGSGGGDDGDGSGGGGGIDDSGNARAKNDTFERDATAYRYEDEFVITANDDASSDYPTESGKICSVSGPDSQYIADSYYEDEYYYAYDSVYFKPPSPTGTYTFYYTLCAADYNTGEIAYSEQAQVTITHDESGRRTNFANDDSFEFPSAYYDSSRVNLDLFANDDVTKGSYDYTLEGQDVELCVYEDGRELQGDFDYDSDSRDDVVVYSGDNVRLDRTEGTKTINLEYTACVMDRYNDYSIHESTASVEVTFVGPEPETEFANDDNFTFSTSGSYVYMDLLANDDPQVVTKGDYSYRIDGRRIDNCGVTGGEDYKNNGGNIVVYGLDQVRIREPDTPQTVNLTYTACVKDDSGDSNIHESTANVQVNFQ